ncbi:MAG: L,D-transpeptidase family protein [Pelagibacterales bacterium]|nr:L,D-transpeptidase family protein [Pelagibacterales bacterium]
MIIKLKNKDTLIVDKFKLKCCIGKNGTSKNKIEGDLSTPRGKFKIGNLYWRADRVQKPKTKLFCKKIKKNMGWCNDGQNFLYNKQIKINKKIKHEKLYRSDFKYDYFILIKYNYDKVKKNKGSAIFIHLTKEYKPTAGCVVLLKKDFLILAKIIKKNTRIIII